MQQVVQPTSRWLSPSRNNNKENGVVLKLTDIKSWKDDLDVQDDLSVLCEGKGLEGETHGSVIGFLIAELDKVMDMMLCVTAVCNGSSTLDHMDAFRTADAVLQEQNNMVLVQALDKIQNVKALYPTLENSLRLRACISEATTALHSIT
jgi:hypothetical protein